jgi:uncharacterized membrane protein
MTWYLLVKWVHILSSTVLFGTGAGIADEGFGRGRQNASVSVCHDGLRSV